MSESTTANEDATQVASGVTADRLADLRRWNLGLTALHGSLAG